MKERELIEQARAASLNAYAPYSGFKVGAALLAEDGSVYTGGNVENASFGATICAERAALSAAVAAGRRRFKSIAVFTDTERPTPPCGICRQALLEFSPAMTVIGAGRGKRVLRRRLSTLLPGAFTAAQAGLTVNGRAEKTAARKKPKER